MNANDPNAGRASLFGLVSEALARSADLVQTEVRLARAEISEKAAELRDIVLALERVAVI